jgi:hypothetical protein
MSLCILMFKQCLSTISQKSTKQAPPPSPQRYEHKKTMKLEIQVLALDRNTCESSLNVFYLFRRIKIYKVPEITDLDIWGIILSLMILLLPKPSLPVYFHSSFPKQFFSFFNV